MRIAVTGASGFVGGAVCRAAVAAGHHVYAFGRRAHLDPAHVGGAPYQPWDITDITAAPLPEPPDVEAVVHCAGSVTDWGTRAAMLAVNRDGTRRVLEAFPKARFVHVSTASVYDPYLPTVQAREDEAAAEPPDPYGHSKAAAENVVRTIGPDAVILRPHAVYGPGDTTLLPRLLESVRGKHLIAVGTGRQLMSLTSIDNLTQACLLATSAPPGVYNITDAAPLALDTALRAFLKARGIDAEPLYLPLRPALALAVAAEAAALLTRRPPRLTRYAVRHLGVERTLDISAACRHLGYRPAETSFAGAALW